MPQIFKDATITKTKSRRPAAGAKMVTRRPIAEIFGVLAAQQILLANSPNKELMHFAQLNLKSLRS